MNPRCPFCYSLAAKNSKPLKQIPIGGGEVTQHTDYFYRGWLINELARKCREYDIIPNLTTNGISIKNLSSLTLRYFGVISLSFDKYKISRIGLREFIDNINYLREIHYWPNKSISNISNIPKIGLNYLLLDRESLFMLPRVIKEFYNLIDSFYILHLKYYPVDYSKEDLKKVLYPLSVFLGNRLYVDDSIQLKLGKKEYCHRGRELITLFPNGDVKACSFDKPIFRIKEPCELKEVVESYYPMKECNICPYLA